MQLVQEITLRIEIAFPHTPNMQVIFNTQHKHNSAHGFKQINTTYTDSGLIHYTDTDMFIEFS